MKKRIFAAVLAFCMLLSLLTGCGAKAADAFFERVDAMAAIEDVQFDLTKPYHGGKLQLDGFVSRSQKTANIRIGFPETKDGDVPYTELYIQNNDIWLNAGQMADAVYCFDMPDYRREDIQSLRDRIPAQWVHYTCEGGELWDGIPGWKELIRQCWNDSKDDLKPYITQQDDALILKADGDNLSKMLNAIVSRMNSHTEEFRSALDETGTFYTPFSMLLDFSPVEIFDQQWEKWDRLVAAPEEGSEPTAPQEVALALTENDGVYTAELATDLNSGWILHVSPLEDSQIALPAEDNTVDYSLYFDLIAGLLNNSRQYINDSLDGVDLSEEMAAMSDDTDYKTVVSMPTEPVEGCSDIVTVNFAGSDGATRKIPIPAVYTSNDFIPDESNSDVLTDLKLIGDSWEMSVYTMNSDSGSADTYIADELQSLYDALVEHSGCQPVTPYDGVVSSGDGQVFGGGFSRLPSEFEAVETSIYCAFSSSTDEYITVKLFLIPDRLTDTDRAAFTQMFETLQLDLPSELYA